MCASALLGARAASAADEAPLESVPPASGAPSTSGVVERAAELYREGNELYDQGKFIEAEARYQEAWNLQRSFDVAGNLGNVELEVQQPRDAAEHLSYALEIFPLGEAAEKKAFLQRRLSAAKAQIGTLRISVNVEGADVLVDGRLIGRSPLTQQVFVDPGKREIEARRAGVRTSTSLFVAKGSDQHVALTLDAGASMTLVIAGGALGLLGVASGVTFALLSSLRGADAEAEPLGSAKRADLRDAQTTFGNLSFWSFVGSGAALAGTAVYVLTAESGAPHPTVESARLRAAPYVTAGGGGVLFGASF